METPGNKEVKYIIASGKQYGKIFIRCHTLLPDSEMCITLILQALWLQRLIYFPLPLAAFSWGINVHIFRLYAFYTVWLRAWVLGFDYLFPASSPMASGKSFNLSTSQWSVIIPTPQGLLWWSNNWKYIEQYLMPGKHSIKVGPFCVTC